MQITAIKINLDVVITLEDASGQDNFSGYRLERKILDGSWLFWDGTQWTDIGDPELLTSTRFTDYDLPAGLYQYRYRIEYTVGDPSDYEYGDWVNIGDEKVGWTFENYEPPEEQFGEVLTADDLRFHFLWGIDFRASNGESFTDQQIRYTIKSTVAEFERTLNIKIHKKKVLCQPDDSLTEGLDYDFAEDPYPYNPHRWTRVGHITLRRAPILSVERFDFCAITGLRILNLLPWIRIDHRKGVIHFFPKAGPTGTIQTSLGIHFTAAGLYFSGVNYPHAYRVDYCVGRKHAGLIPDDLRDVMGKWAAMRLLAIVGDGLLAGFSSSSLSMDGIAESFSSTQGVENPYFGARIKIYGDEIERYIKNNRNKFARFIIGSI